ncbi:class E sortase [Trueperella sp. LYQ143]|uniref:class E sortase n=1 Tax=Trueperella sp. LYQ143 TaxID=3391059 RepID=UPI0039835328
MTHADSTLSTRHGDRRKPSLFINIIGIIGELCITIGLVLTLFIVWQVWWTDIEANREQRAAVEKIQEQFGQVDTTKIAQPQPGPPPDWTKPLAEGETIGVMRIPAFGLTYAYTIQQGTALEEILDKGSFGHYAETALPGQVGNFSTAAHRQTYGAPMLHVDQLEDGDPIVVEIPDAYLVYRVVGHEIVAPDATWTIAPDPFQALAAQQNGGSAPGEPTRRLLTITTCHPPFISNERWIVHAEFEYWTKRSDGIPQPLADPAASGSGAAGVSSPSFDQPSSMPALGEKYFLTDLFADSSATKKEM